MKMRTLTNFLRGRKKVKSEPVSIEEVRTLLQNKDVAGRAIKYDRPGLGLLHRTIDQSGVTAEGLCEFVGMYFDKTYGHKAFHEEYRGRKGSMHYVDFVFPMGELKFKEGKWRSCVDYWEPLGEIRYFIPGTA